jgi:hypothetical protein
VEVYLPAATRTVELQTVPSGARVYLDGQLMVGQTPLRFAAGADDFHDLRIEKVGYEPLSHAIKPEDTAPLISFELQPEKQPRGILWVDANRAAQVFVDGADTGLVTPTLGIRVTAGSHVIELRDGAGTVGAHVTAQVAKGETVHLTLDFAPEKATGLPAPEHKP